MSTRTPTSATRFPRRRRQMKSSMMATIVAVSVAVLLLACLGSPADAVTLDPSDPSTPRFLADVNGAGRADFCRFVGNLPNVFLACNLAKMTDDGFESDQYAFRSDPGIALDLGYPNLPRFLADVNGDGRADFCRFVGDPPNIFLACDLAKKSPGVGFEADQYAFRSEPGLSLDPGYSNLPGFLADVNGDRR